MVLGPQELERHAILRLCVLSGLSQRTVSFIHDDCISDFNDAFFDALGMWCCVCVCVCVCVCQCVRSHSCECEV
jgi:hypothetical protein